MRRLAIATSFGWLIFACSSSGAGTPNEEQQPGWVTAPPVSGSRLRAKVVTGEGARELVAFFDTARNEDCTFQEVDRSRVFCLPNAALAPLGVVYADPSCQKPIVSVPTCAAGVKYIAVTTVSTGPCGQSISGMRTVSGPATTLYIQSGGNGCIQSQQQNVAPAGTSALAAGDLVGFDQFVEAEVIMESRSGITQRIAVGSDGARQHLGYRNDAMNVDCTFQVMADGVARCAPRAGSGELVYSDSECTRPIGAHSTGTNGTCQVATVVREADPTTACARAFYSVGPQTSSFDVDSGYIGTISGSACATAYQNAKAMPITDMTASLAKASRIGSGSTRLVPALVGGRPEDVLVSGWHDNERDVDCVFAKASDGKIRCLPNGVSSLVFWTDSECKAPTRLAVPSGQRGCVPAGERYARASDNACTTTAMEARRLDDTTRVFSLSGDARRVGASSVETSPGRCVKVAGIVGAVDATEINPADFVEATLVTE